MLHKDRQPDPTLEEIYGPNGLAAQIREKGFSGVATAKNANNKRAQVQFYPPWNERRYRVSAGLPTDTAVIIHQFNSVKIGSYLTAFEASK